MEKSTKWDMRFLDMARLVATWSSCSSRQVGAVITKDNRVLATGYNGAPNDVMSCVQKGECMRKRLGIESGTRHDICYATHAEQNAIIQIARMGGVPTIGATLYCTHKPCSICTRMIISAGIARVVYINDYPDPDDFVLSLFREAGVVIDRHE